MKGFPSKAIAEGEAGGSCWRDLLAGQKLLGVAERWRWRWRSRAARPRHKGQRRRHGRATRAGDSATWGQSK